MSAGPENRTGRNKSIDGILTGIGSRNQVCVAMLNDSWELLALADGTGQTPRLNPMQIVLVDLFALIICSGSIFFIAYQRNGGTSSGVGQSGTGLSGRQLPGLSGLSDGPGDLTETHMLVVSRWMLTSIW